MSGPIRRTWRANMPPGIEDQVPDMSVRAFDADEAALLVMERIGIALVPCCELSEPYCAACQKEADDDATERRISIAMSE